MRDPSPPSRSVPNRLLPILCLIGLIATGPASPREMLPGPYAAQVVAVQDGDTVRVRTRIWLGTSVEISVRLLGIDTPERRSACERERQLAEAARRAVAALLADGKAELRDISYGKYAGRVVARILSSRGEDVGDVLLARGLGRSYDGGARRPWCGPDRDGG